MSSKILKDYEVISNYIVEIIKAQDWTYDYDEDNECIYIEVAASSNEINIPLVMQIDKEREFFTVISALPIPIEDEKQDEMAIAVNIINNILVFGSFDYNYLEGAISYRFTSSFRKSLISKSAYEFMIGIVLMSIETYLENLTKLAFGEMTIEEFNAFVQG